MQRLFFLVQRGVLHTLGLLLILLLAPGCDDNAVGSDPGAPSTRTYTFEASAEGWTGGFTDYSTSKSAAELELVFDRRPLPDEVNRNGMALFLAGRNESDDLFMFLKREVADLTPNTTYAITFELDIASDAGSGCTGIGGAPGESVFLKAGAATVEPQPVVQEGDYRLNVDKSNQASGGQNAMVIGDVANGTDNCSVGAPYQMISRDNEETPFTISTDADGTLWLLVGTDSGFEGKTALYYDTIRVTLDAQ